MYIANYIHNCLVEETFLTFYDKILLIILFTHHNTLFSAHSKHNKNKYFFYIQKIKVKHMKK